MITHEDMRDLVNSVEDDDFECKFTNRMNIFDDYITQQENISKLLGLYQKLIKDIPPNMQVLDGYILKQIKELKAKLNEVP